MAKQIYRKEALDELASPEQLDQIMPLTSPRGWWALAGVGLLLALALAWGILGTARTKMEAEGVLHRPADVTEVKSPTAGTVRKLLVASGEEVPADKAIMEIQPAGDSRAELVRVRSPVKGRVEFFTLEGSDIVAGTPLFSIENPQHPLQAVVYVPASEGYQIQPGMEVELKPATSTQQYSQYLKGEVVRTGRRPATREAMFRTLGSEEWIDSLIQPGPVLRIDVALALVEPEVLSGTPCRAFITTSKQRPIELLLPTSEE